MFVDVRGGTKSQRDTVTEAAYFAKSYLMPKIQKLYVEIVLRKMDSDADMLQGDDDREYDVRVKKGMSKEDLMTAIFHEFVHIKQDVRKEYPIGEISDIPYFDRPWEIEAYALQEEMLKSYSEGVDKPARICQNISIERITSH